jgi:phosphoglycolate phosphatase
MIKIEELDEMRRMSIRERSEKLNVPMYKMLMNIPQFYKRYRQAIQEIHLFPKMNYVLNELGGKGIKTAIISSNSEEKY